MTTSEPDIPWPPRRPGSEIEFAPWNFFIESSWRKSVSLRIPLVVINAFLLSVIQVNPPKNPPK
ncbi:hypothetical protein [Mesomycoplasma hyopneumoniae]|uniref:hypothetical protein n=1 Tax=Mesomycoplasma hyopneumoniae TaxID=2099 RepID=UPI003857EE99